MPALIGLAVVLAIGAGTLILVILRQRETRKSQSLFHELEMSRQQVAIKLNQIEEWISENEDNGNRTDSPNGGSAPISSKGNPSRELTRQMSPRTSKGGSWHSVGELFDGPFRRPVITGPLGESFNFRDIAPWGMAECIVEPPAKFNYYSSTHRYDVGCLTRLSTTKLEAAGRVHVHVYKFNEKLTEVVDPECKWIYRHQVFEANRPEHIAIALGIKTASVSNPKSMSVTE